MKKTEKLFRELKKNRLVALLSPGSAEDCLAAYELFSPEGVVLEIALRSEHALRGIRLVTERYQEALVLAGTVMTAQQAEEAIDAGAACIVSADYIQEVVDVCVKNDIMCVPGGLSDAGKQLVRKAEKYGCSLDELKKKYPYQWIYKLFPAFSGRSSNMELARAWRGPYRDLTVVYTGGISLSNLHTAAKSDPTGIFCASALTKNLGDLELLRKDIIAWKAAMAPPVPGAAEPSIKKQKSSSQASKVVAFGELMLRLSPPLGVRLQNCRSFDAHFGGAEANVAVSLARFGLNSTFVTALPDNDVGDNALNTLRSLGVDTSSVVRTGNRLGVYYLEHGSGPRPSKVIYDRSHSAFSEIEPEDLDWERILDGAVWFHWTGITPALGDSVAATLIRALETARKRGITVSADLNYRKKLWSEDQAHSSMTELMPYVDILIANEEDPARVFGIVPKGANLEKGEIEAKHYKAVAERLIENFGLKKVAITLRESLSASENRWSACLYDGHNFCVSPKFHLFIVDRVGAGDAFAAGLIYGLLSGKSDQEALNFGVAASCLKHSMCGDFNLVSAEEVEHFAAGHTGGRVQR